MILKVAKLCVHPAQLLQLSGGCHHRLSHDRGPGGPGAPLCQGIQNSILATSYVFFENIMCSSIFNNKSVPLTRVLDPMFLPGSGPGSVFLISLDSDPVSALGFES